MLFIYGWVNMMHCVTHTLCHGQHNEPSSMVVWVNLGQLM